ncbi:MFS transporter [Nonomuraea sp. LPB2021202275-12-8]|uniref:MFS transporter n=1 Tax=Nonomuraea sp. LPB2021202275-12-8 TaxID=3120159 RepID=UPI00300D81ED
MVSQRSGPKRWLILVVLCMSSLVLVIDNMVLNVAIPPLTRDLGATSQDIQWILDSYILVFAGLLLIAGSLSDRYGRRRIMILGLVIFGVASLAATFAQDPLQLVAGRIAMGIGGALIMPSTLSILITVFTDEKERRKALTAWSAVTMVGLVGGPVVGGLLIAELWWGVAFLINVPIAALAIIAALALMPESKGPWRRPDPVGAVLSIVGMTALVWAIIELPHGGITHPGILAASAAAAACLIGFVIWEIRSDSPMVPMSLFRDRNFSGASLSVVLLSVANGGLLLVLTQYLQFVHGYSPMQAGLTFLPVAVASLLFNVIGAVLGSKVGNRALVAVGMLIMAIGIGVLGTVDATDDFWLIGVALGVVGMGSGLAIPTAINALMGAVPAEHAGVGSAVNDTIQQAGAALGVAILGSVMADAYTKNMPAGAPEAARHNISDALKFGDPALASVAREAFTNGMALTFTASACAVVLAAVIATFILRDRKPAAAQPDPAPAEERVLAGTTE